MAADWRKLQALGAQLAAEQERAVLQNLADAAAGAWRREGAAGRARRGLPVLELAADAAERVTRFAENSPDRVRRACRPGCAWCCHVAVSVTAPEALWIAERLRRARRGAALAAVTARIAETSAQVSHLTIEQRAAARVPCALLDGQGACSIYEFRPVGCRGWTSLDAGECERAFRAGLPGHGGACDRLAWAVSNAVTEGLERGLRRLGYDWGPYELHSAVLVALRTPGAALRWAGGENIFAGCARVRSGRLAFPGGAAASGS